MTDSNLAARLVMLCRARGVTLATAESCTGGLIAAAITAIPGSSAVLDRGFVTYSNAAKTELLGVPAGLINAVGAVSEAVASRMAAGAKQFAGVDIAVSVTGIAGPDGGTTEKPVGTVWFGLANRHGDVLTRHRQFPGDRAAIRAASVSYALTLLLGATENLGFWEKAKREGRKLAFITAYDDPFARLADAAGLDGVLIGDSLGMMVAGDADTLRVSLEQTEYHTRIVAKAVKRALVMADLPFGSFEESPAQAFAASARLLKAGAEIVKLEGGAPMVETVAFLSARAIPVCAHIGLTPQHVRQLGGFKRQGKTQEAAARIFDDALALEAAGARMVLMEAIPSELATEITRRLTVPTIGIGAGPGTDAQILVIHDVLGLNMDRTPGFARAYVNGAALMQTALTQYVEEVRSAKFPE